MLGGQVLGTSVSPAPSLEDGSSKAKDPSISLCEAGGQWGKEEGCGLIPWVSQLWRAPNKPSLFTCKETGLLDGLGGVQFLSGLQKGF